MSIELEWRIPKDEVSNMLAFMLRWWVDIAWLFLCDV